MALADHRQFGRAAEACRVSQPTVSTQIRMLAPDVGASLLERRSGSVVLTPFGRECTRASAAHYGWVAEEIRKARVGRSIRKPDPTYCRTLVRAFAWSSPPSRPCWSSKKSAQLVRRLLVKVP